MERQATNAQPLRDRQQGVTNIEYIVILILVAILIAFTSPGTSDYLMKVFRK